MESEQDTHPLDQYIQQVYSRYENASINEVSQMFEEVTDKVKAVSPNGNAARTLFVHIINSIFAMAQEDNNSQFLSNLLDFSKVLEQGVGLNPIGLNEGEKWQDEVKYAMKANADKPEVSPLHNYKYSGPEHHDKGVMHGPGGETVEVDIADLDEVRALKKKGFKWSNQ